MPIILEKRLKSRKYLEIYCSRPNSEKKTKQRTMQIYINLQFLPLLKDKLLFLMKPQNHHLKTIKLIKRFHISTNIFIKFIYSTTQQYVETSKNKGNRCLQFTYYMGSLQKRNQKKKSYPNNPDKTPNSETRDKNQAKLYVMYIVLWKR